MEDTTNPMKLEYTGFGYKWIGANVPQHLRGLWLSQEEAIRSAKGYLEEYNTRKKAQQEKKAKLVNCERTPLEDLDLLSRKEDLLGFASKHEISIPQDKKMPAQIKSFIKKTLERRDG